MQNSDHNINSKGSAQPKRSLFGRRQGRALGDERKYVLEHILPEISPPPKLLSEDHSHAPQSYFKKKFSTYWLEIGFGHGEHVAGLMRQNPDTGYLGAEPFINGMSSFLKDIEQDPRDNLRAIMADGMILARSIVPKSLDGIYILNPDPWHKKRHNKRRIINQENLDVFSKILKKNGKLVMTTDVPYLAEWMCTQSASHPDFEWSARSRRDWDIAPEDWIKTKYEIKGAKGAKKMSYLFFERK